ncbi:MULTISPECIES: hypothetical protein [Polaribacter]|uniref:hypothetical protein n=1 Tax=Polaribacter TaxID=52959 RepID=UPI0026487022|nr:hypothetical protein [Polaribacter huanghezhanensis]WKD85848.1 hypothetical protein KCTC32516_01195 [Polaribacter huanghezhanensis]
MKSIYLSAFCLLLMSCATVPQFTYYKKIPNETLTIGTEGVVIEAEDGSFKWESGKVNDVTNFKFNNGWNSSGAATKISLSTENFAGLNKETATRVKITTPYSDKTYYGLLEMAGIYSKCKDKSPETRSYYVQIPKSYIDAAEGGRVSVVYEYYSCERGYFSNNTKVIKRAMTTWVLWLSDRPL